MPAPAFVAAAKAAAAVLSDKRLRTAILSAIVGVIAAIVIIIIMFVSLLTMPFSELSGILGGDEYDNIIALRNDYGFDQNIDPSDEDYLNSAGQDFSGVSFTDGATVVHYYNQLDARWKDEPYGLTGTIGSSACGPTSLAMVVSSLTDQIIDPVQIVPPQD